MINHKNLLYALEVSKQGSVNKAAEKLYIGQPNLSKMIIGLEEELGVALFRRTPKGMIPTADGEVIFRHAEEIYRQTGFIEEYCKNISKKALRMSAAVPWADYISEAFTNFLGRYSGDRLTEFSYIEADSESIINKVIYNECHLGIVRYNKKYDKNFRKYFEDRSLVSETLCESGCVAIFGENSQLAERRDITADDMRCYFEVRQNDQFVPDKNSAQLHNEADETSSRVIYVSSGAAQAELVSRNSRAYMITPPLSDRTLAKYGLIQKEVRGLCREDVDIFIRSENYSLTKTDNAFLDELMISKRKYKQEVLL
ncbi:MAG: LysR family transcriptional regulator [Ruminococcus sp.]|nr:LysR family transcriptional regulator [Ruminococcus sp.]